MIITELQDWFFNSVFIAIWQKKYVEFFKGSFLYYGACQIPIFENILLKKVRGQ